tara:strand:- start:692 stop:1012 length:321 start_codon:yes stop_codon:yes gene_type:complete
MKTLKQHGTLDRTVSGSCFASEHKKRQNTDKENGVPYKVQQLRASLSRSTATWPDLTPECEAVDPRLSPRRKPGLLFCVEKPIPELQSVFQKMKHLKTNCSNDNLG